MTRAADLTEATRLYQAALENRRLVRAELEGMVSVDDILDHANDQLAQASNALERAWLEAIPS